MAALVLLLSLLLFIVLALLCLHTRTQIRKLLTVIFQEGTLDGKGHSHISFGRLARKTTKLFWGQALVGHLKAAKVKGAVDFKAERLVLGVTDAVDIIGIKQDIADSNPDTCTFAAST